MFCQSKSTTHPARAGWVVDGWPPGNTTTRALGNTWCTRHMVKPRSQVGRVCYSQSHHQNTPQFTTTKCAWSLELEWKKKRDVQTPSRTRRLFDFSRQRSDMWEHDFLSFPVGFFFVCEKDVFYNFVVETPLYPIGRRNLALFHRYT